MEILNQVTLAGNLTDKPSIDDAGGRVFVRARLAQNWFYDTHGKTVEHRQFLPSPSRGKCLRGEELRKRRQHPRYRPVDST